VFLSAITLFWQLFVLFACFSGLGLVFRHLLPKELSFLNKGLFCLMAGLFIGTLVTQTFIYLGMPVRISAWILLGTAFSQVWLSRRRLIAWKRALCSNAEIWTLAVLTSVTIIFHGIVPIRQGLEWYSGKGYPDYYNYISLAEFLKEEPYSTNEKAIDLRPWLIKPVTVLKGVRLGQSIITAQIGVWSGTNAKGGYAATVIFFLTLLAICLYVLLRETGIDRFVSGLGALLAALLPALTRLSLDGFLSQVAVLFVFPFFASLLRSQSFSARSFTLFFSLTLAYLVSAYSEIAPIGLCTFVLGVLVVRHDKFRVKRLMLMGGLLLIALMNPFYIRNLIQFLGEQYYIASKGDFLAGMAPNVVTVPGWSQLFFGIITSTPFALFFDYLTLLLALLFLAGAIFLTKRDRLIFGAILLPGIFLISCLATRSPVPSYPIAKITLTILPLVIGLVFVGLSQIPANSRRTTAGVPKKLLAAFIVAAAAGGSFRYYADVLNSSSLLVTFREPRFLNVCRRLEEIRNKRLYLFENDNLLTPWLCYHARHNDVYADLPLNINSAFSRNGPFAKARNLENIDFAVTPFRIFDLRAPTVSSTP
jgi:hypothetical protein